ncbi:MAG TPA: NAD(P)/FAD-dependent oxidoreductase, partial [Actinomycetota bacterium]|nr:NAD(P)/FAD-dependent oxidoreductase [Actinomycetota bacterium]
MDERRGTTPERHDVLVVGAGPAGLAAGAMLSRRGAEVVLLDAAARVGDGWRRHYDRLRLHTVRWLSGLPGMPIPREYGKWVPRDRVADYLEAYARRFALQVRTSAPVNRLDRDGGGWTAATPAGAIRADHVVVATGFNREPYLPGWPGRDGFRGELVHSSAYRTPAPYRRRRVLVVGTGNSGAEIAVDLADAGAEVVLSVRTGPHIMRRDLFGFPSQTLGVAMRRLPPRVVDRLQRGVQRVAIGDLERYGMPPPSRRGMYTRLLEESAVPILDVGLVRLLKQRRVRVVAAVERLDGDDVVLADGSRVRVDAIVAATGFRRGLEPLVGHLGVLDDRGRPLVH